MGLDHLVDAPYANILIVTGVLFLGIAAVGKVIGGWFGTVAPNKSGRIMSGFLGLGLVAGELLFRQPQVRGDMGSASPMMDKVPLFCVAQALAQLAEGFALSRDADSTT